MITSDFRIREVDELVDFLVSWPSLLKIMHEAKEVRADFENDHLTRLVPLDRVDKLAEKGDDIIGVARARRRLRLPTETDHLIVKICVVYIHIPSRHVEDTE